MLIFKKYGFLDFRHFLKNGSPEQTTMLMRRAAKFWVEPRPPFSESFHQESKNIGKPLNIVSWPECQPEFPSDGGDGGGGDGGDGFPRTLPIWPGPWAITPRDQISREGNPSLRSDSVSKWIIIVSRVNILYWRLFAIIHRWFCGRCKAIAGVSSAWS